MGALKLTRLEIWDDTALNGGSRVAFYAPPPVSARRMREVDNPPSLTLQLVRDSADWSEIQKDRVLRPYLSDGSWEEYRVGSIKQQHSEEDQTVAVVEAQHIVMDLGIEELVEKRNADGAVLHAFDFLRATPEEHLQLILERAPAYFSLGDVEATTPISLSYDWDTPLSAIRQLQGAPGVSLELDWDIFAGKYRLHLRERVGVDADKVYLRVGRNVPKLEIEEHTGEDYSRIYPRGGELEGFAHTMGEAEWEVAAVIAGGPSDSIQLDASDVAPLAFDDQFVGLFVERDNGQLFEIEQTRVEDQEIGLVDGGTGISQGEMIKIRRDNLGRQLTYVERPGEPRIRSTVLERPDIPAVENLVPNPWFSAASWFEGWAPVGAPTVSQVTAAPHVRLGASSAQVSTLVQGEGIRTDWIPVSPSAERPFFTSQITLWVNEGVVRFELLCQATPVAGGSTIEFVVPDWDTTGGRAYTSRVGAWIDRLQLLDELTPFYRFERDGELYTVTQVQVHVLADRLDADTGACSWWLDAAQLVQGSLLDLPFYDGRASRRLWEAANVELLRDAPISLSVNAIDLFRADPEGNPTDELVLGGTCEVDSRRLNLTYLTRLRSIEEELTQPEVIEVRLSTDPDELTPVIGDDGRRVFLPATLDPRGAAGRVDGDPILDEDDGVLKLIPNKFSGAQSVRYVVGESTPTRDDVLASGLTSNDPEIDVHTFTESGEKRFVGLVYHPGPDGEGAPARVHILDPWVYNAGDDAPFILWDPKKSRHPGWARIQTTVLDDGDQVALYARDYVDGGTPPAYTRYPASGFVSDPFSVTHEVERPDLETDPDRILEVYAEDDGGNLSRIYIFRIDLDSISLEEPVLVVEFDEDPITGEVYLEWYAPHQTIERLNWYASTQGEVFEQTLAVFGHYNTQKRFLLHTFDPNTHEAQQLWLGYKGESEVGPGGAPRAVTSFATKEHVFRPSNDQPYIIYAPLDRGSNGVERHLVVAADGGDQVAIFTRHHDKGGTAPAYTRSPASGYAADPLPVIIEFPHPADGDPNHVLEAYAEDDEGHESELFYRESDPGNIPTADFDTVLDRDSGVAGIIPRSTDTDALSWRCRVNRVNIGTDTFLSPTFSDSASDEFSGSTFGSPQLFSTYPLKKGQQLNIVALAFNTTASDDASQQAAQRSAEIQLQVKMDIEGGLGIRVDEVEWLSAETDIYTGKIHLWVGSRVKSVKQRVVVWEATEPSTPGGSWGSATNVLDETYDHDLTGPDDFVIELLDSAGDPIEFNHNSVIVSIGLTPYTLPSAAGVAGEQWTKNILNEALSAEGSNLRVLATDGTGAHHSGTMLEIEDEMEVVAGAVGPKIQAKATHDLGTISSSGNLALDFADGATQKVTYSAASGALVVQVPSNMPDGKTLRLFVSISSTGDLDFATGFLVDGGESPPYSGAQDLALEITRFSSTQHVTRVLKGLQAA